MVKAPLYNIDNNLLLEFMRTDSALRERIILNIGEMNSNEFGTNLES